MAVGPGTIEVEGQRSATFDLKKGQRVYVKHKENSPRGLVNRYAPIVEDGQTYALVEQSAIIGIIAEPGSFTPADLSDAPKSAILHA